MHASGFNPRRILERYPSLAPDEANSQAWWEMVRLLRRAIDERGTFAFETTLGGGTITGELERATRAGLDVRVWFVALSSADQHVDRVRRRVAQEGHPVPEVKIRRRYDSSRRNLIRLLPGLRQVRLLVNSTEADPFGGYVPDPLVILEMSEGQIIDGCGLDEVPGWAKLIVVSAITWPSAEVLKRLLRSRSGKHRQIHGVEAPARA